MAKFEGKAIKLKSIENSFYEIIFDLEGESVNKFNALTLSELGEVVSLLKKEFSCKGLLLSSAKDPFIVGADITEFLEHFKKSEAELKTWLLSIDEIFNSIEDFSFPTVAAVNGFALGGGMEVILPCAFRVMSEKAKIGLPETKLGIMPGWGGSVRLSRICGADTAIEWICSGNQYGAEDALKVGAVDAVVPHDQTRSASLELLKRAASNEIDWRKRQEKKRSPLFLNKTESLMVFQTSKAFVASQAGPNYPAPVAAIDVIEKGSTLTRDQALPIEAEKFAYLAKTPQAKSLVRLFLNDQFVKKVSKKHTEKAKKIKKAAVLGAGIMGGGIAYQSAVRGTPIVMKDIRDEALQSGMKEAMSLLEKQVSRGKMSTMDMGKTLAFIKPTLLEEELKGSDLLVEAVVENEEVKKKVLADMEQKLGAETVLTSNTSTISITRLSDALKNPENFCGMHFFNPVPKMPLVEVIRGKKSSETSIATTVSYALSMGKTPIVVNDCPGFLVNRVLFAYFSGFNALLRDGVNFLRIDKVMEKYGWPMGPAYLLDVVGLDTGVHASKIMAQEFPDRMSIHPEDALVKMFEKNRYGQKNGKGFYSYSIDKKGRPQKTVDEETFKILGMEKSQDNQNVTDEQIMQRMMIPMIFESALCLEEKIVETPAELDLALIYGLGFPPFRGGIMHDASEVGVKKLVEQSKTFETLGSLYKPGKKMKELAEQNRGFYE